MVVPVQYSYVRESTKTELNSIYPGAFEFTSDNSFPVLYHFEFNGVRYQNNSSLRLLQSRNITETEYNLLPSTIDKDYIVTSSSAPYGTVFTYNFVYVDAYQVESSSNFFVYNGTYDSDDSSYLFGQATYIHMDYSGASGSSRPQNRLTRVANTFFVDNSQPLNFLYDFGTKVVSSSETVYDVLNYQIGGYSLLSLLFGSGFLVFLGWVVVKWVIP